MRIAIGCDHRGLKLKQAVMKLLADGGHSYQDFGCYTDESVDYPDIALKVAKVVANGDFDRGILICSTGIGMCIAANKVKGIRAALAYDTFAAERACQHNNANILCLGADRAKEVPEIVNTFLTCKFEGGRHQRRIDKIKDIEGSCS